MKGAQNLGECLDAERRLAAADLMIEFQALEPDSNRWLDGGASKETMAQ
jgi:hypothetical protein